MTTKTKQRPAKRPHKKTITNKKAGVGITGRVNTTGMVIKTRMIRVDARLADFLATEATKGGCTLVTASGHLYESVS